VVAAPDRRNPSNHPRTHAVGSMQALVRASGPAQSASAVCISGGACSRESEPHLAGPRDVGRHQRSPAPAIELPLPPSVLSGVGERRAATSPTRSSTTDAHFLPRACSCMSTCAAATASHGELCLGHPPGAALEIRYVPWDGGRRRDYTLSPNPSSTLTCRPRAPVFGPPRGS